jgi:hypothetical protein
MNCMLKIELRKYDSNNIRSALISIMLPNPTAALTRILHQYKKKYLENILNAVFAQEFYVF